MKNSEKLLFGVALLACIGGGVAYALLSSSAGSKPLVQKSSPRGAESVVWTDKSAEAQDAAAVWKAPNVDAVGGWNYDLFTSPEISWDSKQGKYFAKELPPPPEEVFGLTLKSIAYPKFRLVINSYSAGTKPVPEQPSPGRFAAVLMIADHSGARPVSKAINFGAANMLPVSLSDNTNSKGVRSVVLTPEKPVTIPGTNAKLKSFRISQSMDASGFSEELSAVVIDETGRAPREFVIGTTPVSDKNRVDVVFSDGYKDWRYSEIRIPGRKDPVREISSRSAPDEPFTFVENGQEIHIGDDVFRIKGLDISGQQVRIEKVSAEVDKKTKLPKTTERVLSPEK